MLDGALALALPCQLGQQLEVAPSPNQLGHWLALDERGQPWLEVTFRWPNLELERATDPKAGQMLLQMLEACRGLGTRAFSASPLQFTTRLEFNRQWGLGSSSTLLSMLGQWAMADPFALSEASFGGSGYDLACAMADGPLLFQRKADRPGWVDIPWRPAFADQVYFVYLGKKQNSREGISRYRKLGEHAGKFMERIGQIGWAMTGAESLGEWAALMDEHEQIISQILQLPKVKDLYFRDYWGSLKSLGAWGGDFAMATSDRSPEETREYFRRAGFVDLFRMDELGLFP